MSYKQKSYIRQFGNKQNFMETNIVEDISHLVEKTNNTPTYKVYTALLTQNGTDAPVATVLENTIGDIVWTYDSVGIYLGTLINAFTSNKTFLTSNLDYSNADLERVSYLSYGNSDSLTLYNLDFSDTKVNGIASCYVEIRVYN